MNNTILKSTRFALRANELAIYVNDEVVPLIGPEGDQDLVPASHQLGEYRGLGSQADINWVRAWFGRLQAKAGLHYRQTEAFSVTAQSRVVTVW